MSSYWKWFFRQGVIVDHEEPETFVVVEDGTNYGQGIEVITEFNAPMSPDTLQKITSGVTEQNSMAFTNVAPSSTRSFMASANQMSEGTQGAERGDSLAQNGISGSRGRTMTTSGNMAASVAQRNNFGIELYHQQLLQTQKLFFEQQASMKSLSEAVLKMQKTMKRPPVQDASMEINPRHNRKRKSHEISSDESVQSDSESGEYTSSSEDDVDITPPVKKGDKSSVDRKKDKLKSAERTFGNETNLAPAVDSEIAKTVNKGLSTSVEHKSEKIKKLMDKYDRPENCEFIDVPKVAKSIWTSKQTAKEVKESDKSLQRTQSYLTKGLIPLVQIMNKTLNAETEEAEEIFDMALDAFKLLAHSHRDLSSQRKRLLMPAISGKFRSLCGDSTPITPTQLFGEDLTQQIKDIEERSKIENKLSYGKWKGSKGHRSEKGDDYQKYNGYKNRKGQSPYNKNSSFLGRKGPRSHQNKFQKKSNLGRHQK